MGRWRVVRLPVDLGQVGDFKKDCEHVVDFQVGGPGHPPGHEADVAVQSDSWSQGLSWLCKEERSLPVSGNNIQGSHQNLSFFFSENLSTLVLAASCPLWPSGTLKLVKRFQQNHSVIVNKVLMHIRLDSIAVSLFGNMTVEPGEIHIITKEWDGCRDPSGKGCKTFEGPQISDKWTKLPFVDRLALLCM